MHPSQMLFEILSLFRAGATPEFPQPAEVAAVRADLARRAAVAFTPAAAGTVAIDADATAVAQVALPAGNVTIAAPTGTPYIGQRLIVELTQDGVGGRSVTWNAAFDKAADGAGTANQRAVASFYWNGTKWRQMGSVTYGT